MNIAKIYQLVYLSLASILTFYVYSRYRIKTRNTILNPHTRVGELLLVAFLMLFIGFRPESGYFVDMASYIVHYQAIYEGASFSFDWTAENLLFDNYFAWVGSMRLGTTFFFATIAVVYFGASYLGLRKMFPNDTLAAYLVFLGAFSTFSYGTNGIKAGSAASLFILAIAYRENLKLCILLAIFSLGFHHSMKLPLAALALVIVYKNPKVYFYAWIVCLLMSVTHLSFFQELFAGIAEDAEGYLDITGDEGKNARTGFRLDFVLYSAMPVLVGYYSMFKKRMKLSKSYIYLLDMYLCTNGIWMLCMYANFTNRIAYLSWFLYPVVLIYPFLNENWGPSRYKVFAKVMILHLVFTLFMDIVIYGSMIS